MAAPVHVEMSDYGLGRIFPVPGGLGANVEQLVALNETVREIHGTTSVYSYFRRMEKRVDEKKTLPYMNFLKRMIEQGKQEEYVCLLFTIHNLSMINQNYGYQQAEIIMRLYCSLITARTEENEIVALMGNTHFVAAIHKERLEKVIEQLTTGVSVPFLPGEELRVAAKVAVYWPQKQDTSASMISERLSTTYSLLLQDKTKMVMYHDHELRKRLEEEDRIFELIEPALEHREFEVYYQPKVDMHTRQLIGAEALIRWNHDGQVISPAKFVPLCEKRGMIEELAFMRNMRCDVAQGFLFDKPLRHDDFEERLKAEFYPEKLSVM